MKLQNKFMGLDTEKELEKYLEQAKKNKGKPLSTQDKQKPITPANIQDPENYIILPERTHGSYSYPDLLVSTGKYHHNQNWNQTQETLHQNNEFMLTIRQFADFLNLLRSSKAYNGSGQKVLKQKLDQILDEIVTVRDPWRSEWLDARFTKKGRKLQVTYHKINPDGTSQETTEPLETCLMQDKQIDLDYWLNNATPQGLPPENTPDGSLYYWYPRENYVAGFDAGSGGALLVCDGNPRGSDPSLGVRRAKIKS